MHRVPERFSFSEFDTPPLFQGMGQVDLTPGYIKQDVNKITEGVDTATKSITATVENIGMAVGSATAGAIIIFGATMIPKGMKWSTQIKVAGILVGAGIAIGGAAYALKPRAEGPKADPGAVTGASNLFVAPDVILSAEQGWKVFGTPRIDLTVTNRTGNNLQLQISAREYLGTTVTESRLEMTWNPEIMDLGPSSSNSKSFYFVTDKIKSAPGPRTVIFTISDRATGKVYAVWQKGVSF